MSSSDFQAENLRKASYYLNEQLEMTKKTKASLPQHKNVYVVEDKKETIFQKFVGSIFHK